MAYAYRFYIWPDAGAFLAAWADAGLPIEDGAPFIPGGDLNAIGPAGDPPADWYVMAAWPASPPALLASAEIPWREGLPVYAGARDLPGASSLDAADATFAGDAWQAAIA